MRKTLFLISLLAIIFPAVSFASSVSVNNIEPDLHISWDFTDWASINPALPANVTLFWVFANDGSLISNGRYIGADLTGEFIENLEMGTYYSGNNSVMMYRATGSGGADFINDTCTLGKTQCESYLDIIPQNSYYINSQYINIAPYSPPGETAFLTVPGSTAHSTLGKVTEQLSDLGFLKIIVLAMALPMSFLVAEKIIKMVNSSKKKKA